MHITIIVKNNLLKKKRKEKTTTAQIVTNVRAHGFNARLLARSQFASGRFCDQPSRSRFSVVFLGPRANAKFVPKFHVALHAALPMITFNISPYTNVTLTLGWITLFMGDMGEGVIHREERK
jgi:hypothetical protein